MTHAFFSSYLHHQLSVIEPYISGCRRVLDFGCGDMALDMLLIKKHPQLQITGIDVVPFTPPHHKRLTFQAYKGERLPFRDRSFDAVFSYHVFHHTDNPKVFLKECSRVARVHLIIVEPVLRHPLEKIGFACMDYLTNFWKKERVPMPYRVHTLGWWEKELKALGLRFCKKENVGVLPRFLPIGETLLFVLEKRI